MAANKSNCDFLRKIDQIDISSYNQFNWFQVMYKMTEERILHSRIIAFLLNPKGSHAQESLFLKLFFEEFGINDFDLNGIVVLPEEDKKKEEDNIDILITNAKKHAIIIENKIFAMDSNRTNDSESKQGNCTQIYQIPRYFCKIQDKGYTVTHIIYLTVKDNKPLFYEKFPKEVKKILKCKDYIQSILNWIDKCIANYPNNDAFKVGLEHYKQATTEFLNDFELALELKEYSAEHIDAAFDFWPKKEINLGDKYQVIKSQFIHVKWHTLHEFYTKLSNEIHKELEVVPNEIDKVEITKTTHYNQKNKTVLTFEYGGNVFYICNDANGFSIGRHVKHKKDEDYKILPYNEYAFFDFTKKKVFKLIVPEKRDELVVEIVKELKDFVIPYNSYSCC